MTRPKQIRAALSILFFIAAAVIILYLPPKEISIIIAFIIVSTTAVVLLVSVFASFFRAALAGIFIALFLFMSIFIGFQVLNTILLLCFIIGLERLYASFK
jgi:hypothetical protein